MAINLPIQKHETVRIYENRQSCKPVRQDVTLHQRYHLVQTHAVNKFYTENVNVTITRRSNTASVLVCHHHWYSTQLQAIIQGLTPKPEFKTCMTLNLRMLAVSFKHSYCESCNKIKTNIPKISCLRYTVTIKYSLK